MFYGETAGGSLIKMMLIVDCGWTKINFDR